MAEFKRLYEKGEFGPSLAVRVLARIIMIPVVPVLVVLKLLARVTSALLSLVTRKSSRGGSPD